MLNLRNGVTLFHSDELAQN